MDEIEKMDLASKDLVAERIEQLKALFPEIVVESKDSNDKLTHTHTHTSLSR